MSRASNWTVNTASINTISITITCKTRKRPPALLPRPAVSWTGTKGTCPSLLEPTSVVARAMSRGISSITTRMECPAEPGVTCFGNSNSNKYVTDAGGGLPYSVVGRQFVPFPAPGSDPPAHFNSAPYEYAQRQDTRYPAGLLLH